MDNTVVTLAADVAVGAIALPLTTPSAPGLARSEPTLSTSPRKPSWLDAHSPELPSPWWAMGWYC